MTTSQTRRYTGVVALPLPADRFGYALYWAAKWHAGQTRKVGGGAYIVHPLEVAALVIKHGGSEDQAIAALLHDAVEDTDATLDAIREGFGDHVAQLVDFASDAYGQPKPPWLERKIAHHAKIADAPDDIVLVITADKINNVETTLAELDRYGATVWDSFKGGAAGTVWYYREMLLALSARWGDRGGGEAVLLNRLAYLVAKLADRTGIPLATAAPPGA